MRRLIFLLGMVGVLLGCGGPPSVETVTVKGTLLRDGKPLSGKKAGQGASPYSSYEGYVLEFYAGNAMEGRAEVDEQGRFELSLPANKAYKVTVRRSAGTGPQIGAPPGPGEQGPPGAEPKADKSLEKFATVASTPIQIQVGNSDPTSIEIDLGKY